jgi:prepilin-type N-terminal cleavage/methylation domain-containing protein
MRTEMAETKMSQPRDQNRNSRGFSLLEMLVSVTIVTLLMSAIFPFLIQVQKRHQGSSVIAEANQGTRAALEVMTQEIGQAGYNPNFLPNKTCDTPITANAAPQCVTLNDIDRIFPGDWLLVDAAGDNELVRVTGTSKNGACSSPNQIQAVFQANHPNTPFPLSSYKMPWPAGILTGTGGSDDQTLKFFGDINADGTIRYVEYTLSPTHSPARTVEVDGVEYTLYNLNRSVTEVLFMSGQIAASPSPLVQNVLYNTTLQRGPTGQPLFAYPTLVTVGVVPNQVTVVGTISITLSVAEDPRNLETNQVAWFTMATQIRPLNLSAAVAVSRAGGFSFLPRTPDGLPM